MWLSENEDVFFLFCVSDSELDLVEVFGQK